MGWTGLCRWFHCISHLSFGIYQHGAQLVCGQGCCTLEDVVDLRMDKVGEHTDGSVLVSGLPWFVILVNGDLASLALGSEGTHGG